MKGGGGAHTREKIVAAAADRFVVIASSDKLVERDRASYPARARSRSASPRRSTGSARPGCATLRSTPDGGVLADWLGPVDDPAALADRLAQAPGVVEHGLFAPELVSEVLVGRGETVERI